MTKRPQTEAEILGRFLSGLQNLAHETLDELAEIEANKTQLTAKEKERTQAEISEEPFNALFYEAGSSDKGPYEAARQPQNDNPNFQRCLNILKQNISERAHTFSEKTWPHYYWLSTEGNTIFRRKKKLVQG